MFGRRNPDQPPAPPSQPAEGDLDLDVLSDLPDIPPAAPKSPTTQTLSDSAPQERDSQAAKATAAVTVPGNLPEPTPFTPPAAPSNGITTAPPSRVKSPGESIIGPDDFFDGNYRSERGVRIQGKVRGSIESRQYIYVEASAQVEANLSAEDITVAGAFHGEIECRHRLEITSTGRIRGGVKTVLLVVQEGGALDGQLEMASARADLQ